MVTYVLLHVLCCVNTIFYVDEGMQFLRASVQGCVYNFFPYNVLFSPFLRCLYYILFTFLHSQCLWAAFLRALIIMLSLTQLHN